MKHFTLSLFALLCSFTAWCNYGIFQAGVTIDGTTYVEGGAPSLNGQNFSVVQGGTFNLSFAFVKTFKNGFDDVCGARMHYAVYPAAGSPTFTTKTLCFFANLPATGDQEWNSTNCPFTAVNLAASLGVGSYKIAVYYSAPGGNCGAPADAFFSNGGNNYVANLTITVPLAINLTAFDARRIETGVKLTWQVSAERDHASYKVERRATNGAWLPLGVVQANGTAAESANYTFMDVKPLTGDNYYRLAMNDLAGKTTYSPVVLVKGKSAATWQVAPNPATDEFILRSVEEGLSEVSLVRLYNAQGVLALEYHVADNSSAIRVPLTGLAVGTYWLEIQSADGVRAAE